MHGFVAATFVFFGFLILLPLSSRPSSSSTSCSGKTSFNGMLLPWKSVRIVVAFGELRELDNLSFVISISKPLTPFSWSLPCSSSSSALSLSLSFSVSSYPTLPQLSFSPCYLFLPPRVSYSQFPLLAQLSYAFPEWNLHSTRLRSEWRTKRTRRPRVR